MSTRIQRHCSTVAALAGIGAAILYSAPVVAADFTFQVPVDVQNMPVEVTEGSVNCEVRQRNESPIGQGQQFFGVDSLGDFQQTISVAVNVVPEADPAVAREWTCRLLLRLENGDFVSAQTVTGPGTQTVSAVSGNIQP